MSYTFQSHLTLPSQLSYTFGFAGENTGYISTAHIEVEVRASGDTEWTVLSKALWGLTAVNQVTLLSGIATPADGKNNLRIRRVVPKEKPYAKFVRGSMLDMLNLDRSLIQLTEITQELLDGFLPSDFYYKQNINMDNHKFTNLGLGVNPLDSVRMSQLTDLDNKVVVLDNAQTEWNQRQDNQIQSLQAGIASNGTAAYVPYRYKATGGETVISPPYIFATARVQINGVMQFEVDGAYSIVNNTIRFTGALRTGDVVRCEIGTGWNPNSAGISGTTAQRPIEPSVGYLYFDTTLGKSVWYKGPGWVDATGAAA